MSHWRGRIADKLDFLPAESLRVAHQVGALKPGDLARVTVDTTAQPKNDSRTDQTRTAPPRRHQTRH